MARRLPRLLALTAALATALTVLAAAPAQAAAQDYVALGDSYSSGTGTGSYIETGCYTSTHAYPYQLAQQIGANFSFKACSGARTGDVLNNQVSALNANTDLVTISIGGNDAGFADVVTQCNIPFSNCNDDIANANSYIANTLPGKLDAVYDQISSRAPNARVIVVGYPKLFKGNNCSVINGISAAERTALNDTADRLSGTIGNRAAAHGFTYADARSTFGGHAICDSPSWINGLSWPIIESYHPNRLGHDGYTSLVAGKL
ncbi:SGNH/GDSL hydrolase family protein [Phytomonospora endophytica]|uniref:Lysophospholipase L1-like esterase n=1 Tax=Phytomonospora endophytica TaxID=714109 RepID=A0A841FGZ7_9ACTN|nr:SGNH/GDSL hydrolase family protein [Phytomonospora endophytica]MBB6033118.1 lysophospholipase L1-like esterase [Phytomonospora endophytica]GIG65344.1 lipase 1 [Phytomonospora endophytica]